MLIGLPALEKGQVFTYKNKKVKIKFRSYRSKPKFVSETTTETALFEHSEFAVLS